MGDIIREKRELAYEGAIVKVYKDHMLIDGRKAVWDYIQHNGAAGKVDSKDEPRRICAFRELEEETGYKVASPDELEFLIRIDTMVAFGDEEIDIFVAKNLIKSEQHLDEDESIDVEEWELEDLVDLIYKGELKDSKTVAAIIAYKNKYNL